MEVSKMKKTLCLFMALVIPFTGCASFTFLKNESDYAKINQKSNDNNTTVTLKNGEIINATNVVVKSDSISLWESKSSIKRMIPTPEVKKIIIKDGGEMIKNGFLVGLILVGIPAFVLGMGINSIENGFSGGSTSLSDVLLVGLKGFGFGGLVGAIITGLIYPIYKGDVYGFSEPEPYRLVSIASQAQGGAFPDPPWASGAVPENQMALVGRVIVISERVGEVIDRQERDKYGLYAYINGFQSVEFRQKDDNSYWFYLRYTDQKSGTTKIFKSGTDENTVKLLRDYINQFKKDHLK
jgi:hypothetical protein